jgi:RNA polymerase sigma factor (sigma-70 family)
MTVRNHQQFTGQRPAGVQSPDHDIGNDLHGSTADALGRRSWDEPVGVWGGKTYEELYVEHAPAARRLARSMVPPDVADDVVAEAFAKVLAVIRAGGGPSHAFGGYLLTAVRHQATDWQRNRRRLTAVADLDVATDDRTMAGGGRVTPGIGSAAETQVAARDEARLVARAFGRLPSRWRGVLWELEVEGKAPAAVAPMFGLSANGVSALAMRAREGLRQAYLDEHVGTNIPEACRAYAAEFGAGARGRLTQRRRAAMQEHLTHCHACQDLFTELTELNSRLGTILTPAALAAASAFMHSGRHAAMIRASLSSPWRSWRLHPVTTSAGAAAGVVVAGGMLLAVNVTPFTGSPARASTPPVATQPATASAATPGSGTHRRGKSGSGGGGSAAGTGSLAAPLTASAAPAPPGGAYRSLPAGTVTTGAVSPGISADGGGASGSTATGTSSGGAVASPGQTITTTAGNTLTRLTTTAGAVAWGVTSTVGTAVPGVTGTAGGVVSGATGTAGGVVSGATGTAGGVVSGATGTAGGVVSGATGTAGGVVSGVAGAAGSAVSGAAGTASGAVSGAASTASGAVSGVVSSVTATTTSAASTTAPATNAPATGSANSATAAADPGSPASASTSTGFATSAAAGTAVAATTGIVKTAVGTILQ